jgi:hypothetical protein
VSDFVIRELYIALVPLAIFSTHSRQASTPHRQLSSS